jgi:hypothetical protein
MKNNLRITLATALFMLLVLNVQAIEKPSTKSNGVFGMCDCQSKNGKVKLIELSLNEDFTFTYVDNTNYKKPFSLKGKWINKGNKVVLVSDDNRKSFHRKWKFEKDGRCIKSRYQLNFRRICLIKPC